MSITATRTATSSSVSYIILKLGEADVNAANLCDGTNWLIGTPAGGLTSTFRMYATGGSGASGYLKTDYGSGVQLDTTTITSIQVVIRIEASYNAQNLTFRPMITKHADALYQPYALPNNTLTSGLSNVLDVTGAKNFADLSTLETSKSGTVTFTVNADKTVSVTSTAATSAQATCRLLVNTPVNYTVNTYGGMVLSGSPASSDISTHYMYLAYSNDGYSQAGSGIYISGGQPVILRNDYPYLQVFIIVTNGVNIGSTPVVYTPMICTQEAWNASHKYAPYALPNSELTVLESEDRASLAEVVDSGAKNLFNPVNVSSTAYGTWDASTGTFTQEGTDTKANLNLTLKARTSSSASWVELFSNYDISANGVVSIPFTCPVNATEFRLGHNGTSQDANMIMTGFNIKSGTQCVVQLNVTNAVQASGKYSWKDIMICTKAAFAVSPKFVPYAKSNYSLTQLTSGLSETAYNTNCSRWVYIRN